MCVFRLKRRSMGDHHPRKVSSSIKDLQGALLVAVGSGGEEAQSGAERHHKRRDHQHGGRKHHHHREKGGGGGRIFQKCLAPPRFFLSLSMSAA